GTRRWMEITTLLRNLPSEDHPHARPAVMTGDPPGRIAEPTRGALQGASAYLKIADGCSAPCAFCAIPAIKGPARSRPLETIVAEAQQLVERGAKEIILIAQDTTAYGRDRGERDALPTLMEAVLTAAPDLQWLRLMYAYPQHVTPRLIEVMARHTRICHYLDIPLQHGHPEVLRRMNRPHDVDEVRRLVADLREAMPDIALRTSFIVGYPGETEEEFSALLDFVAEIAFDRVGVFTYSREEGTEAAGLPSQVPAEVKEERYVRLMELQQGISLARNRRVVGRVLEVLVEGQGQGLSVGRSYRDAPGIDGLVIVEGELPVGEMVPVRITGAMEYDLVGEKEGASGYQS
ncbi:MAG TPA: 30S ribosomal protein S12 methylthiotransferase RimO, partial [Anaerolineae bacterium]|nr:30S ribosomal protein S12 methylthiotransferase RimO [Anaerolineae bacterium]